MNLVLYSVALPMLFLKLIYTVIVEGFNFHNLAI
jgi:hypothetical protein